MTPTKTARWVDASAIYGTDAVKLLSTNGATIARVRLFGPRRDVWHYSAGRSRGGRARDKADGIRECNRWAESRGYAIVPLVLA